MPENKTAEVPAEEKTEQLSPKERLKEITANIEEGIKQLFDTDKYKQYLKTMSQFHRYSLNNTMLIYMQKPDATMVAGFDKWKDKFQRHVGKGEKGIKIIAPVPHTVKRSREKIDPDTKAPIMDKDGNPVMEEVEVKVPQFRVVSVFDVSQTYGKPLPTLAKDLQGDVPRFEAFMDAVIRSSPVPVRTAPGLNGADGYFNLDKHEIVIREDMSQVQTVSAMIHEITHAKLHNRYPEEYDPLDPLAEKPKDRRTEEVEAESVSYAVCQYYGIETSDNSFGYIAEWSRDRELPELKASLETINDTASEIISDIDRNLAEIMHERGLDQTKEAEASEKEPDKETAFQEMAGDGYLIYQLREDAGNVKFASLEQMKSQGITPDRSLYEPVYVAPLESGDKTLHEHLNDLYKKFNIDHPADFTGHSMSVSDVVALKLNGKVSYYFVDSFDFQKLDRFMTDNPLKNAEMSVEDDYGMIDGIINNGKVPALEAAEAKPKAMPSLKDQLSQAKAQAEHQPRTHENKQKKGMER